MSRKAALFTEADIKRITKGAMITGAKSVDIIPQSGGGVLFRINLAEGGAVAAENPVQQTYYKFSPPAGAT